MKIEMLRLNDSNTTFIKIRYLKLFNKFKKSR